MFDSIKNFFKPKPPTQPSTFSQPSPLNPNYRPQTQFTQPSPLNASYAPQTSSNYVRNTPTVQAPIVSPTLNTYTPPKAPAYNINVPQNVPDTALASNATKGDVFNYRNQMESTFADYLKNQQAIMAQIQALYTPSEQEQASADALRNFDQSYRMGQAKIEDKPIAMEFITGQQASLQRNAGIERQGLAEQYGALSQARTGQLEALQNQAKMQGDMFGQTMDFLGGQQQFDATQEQNLFERQMAEKKFAEDTRRFGMEYALKARELNAKLAETEAENQKIIATQDQESASTVNLINNLLGNDRLGSITGLLKGTLRIGNVTGSQEVRNQFNQLKGILALENRAKLKGSGAVSDFEAKTLERAASSLGRNLNENDLRKQLAQVKGSVITSHGGKAPVLVKDIETGESQTVLMDSYGIAKAISDGLVIEYQ